VRDAHYKLIEYNVNGKRTTQLFDLLTDPWEKNNLSDNPGSAKQVNIMRRAMLEQKQLTGDKGEFWNGIEFSNETK
jgi:arylsulfatase A-like enzyme